MKIGLEKSRKTYENIYRTGKKIFLYFSLVKFKNKIYCNLL